MAEAKKGAQGPSPQTILCLDESGFYLLPGVTRTWAPRGQTPILRENADWHRLSVISAITPEGKIYFRVQETSIKAADILAFLKHLLRQIPGRLLIIWDGVSIHRSQPIRDFLAAGAAKRIQLERLPAYAPDLNPDEGVWAHLKQVELRNHCCDDLQHLRREFRKATKRLRAKPRVIRGCFAGAGLAIQ